VLAPQTDFNQVNPMSELRSKILDLVKAYYVEKFSQPSFDPDKDSVRYAGRVFDDAELVALVDSSLDFWLTEGRYCEEFASQIADLLGVGNVMLTNSGSSSNLLAISALTSHKLKDRRLEPGAEVITVAAGFPSTVAPILQNRLVPVFVDVDLPTYNANVEAIERAITPKSRAIFLAHTLGNPFSVDAVLALAKQHKLWVIEDNCDAFGSKYRGRLTGTFGHLSTMSFYPAHHITTGEGGAVATEDEDLARLVRSFRDWGRDCYCAGGENNTCGKRFTQQFGTLPVGYDHKYVYSEIGYNLKMTEMQAAIGTAQVKKLPSFCQSRRSNFATYTKFLRQYEKYLLLPVATEGSDPAWFAYIVSVRPEAPFTRNTLVAYLNQHRIETRNIFAGNMVRQPSFATLEPDRFRVAGPLTNTDFVMDNTFFLGTYPGLTADMLSTIERRFAEFMAGY
jgi:CDP-6-deoxy-D-xylo-4-hexulose-3-dehydrase